MKYKIVLFSFVGMLFCCDLVAQQHQDVERLKRRFHLDSIVKDSYNGDGVVKARKKNTQKWGMLQYFSDRNVERLVVFKYDSLGFFDKHPDFAIVKNNDKYGVILSPWSSKGAIESIRCTYDKLAIIEAKGWGRNRNMLAAQKNGKWGYINEETGETLVPFMFKTKTELPSPHRKFYEEPIAEFSPEIMSLFNRPDTITHLDLSYQKLSFLPKQIKECSRLTYLNLEGNNIAILPDELGELQNLKTLYLGFNAELLSGNGKIRTLDFLQTLSNLEYLSLGNINKSKNNRPDELTSCDIDFPTNFQVSKKLKGLSIGCSFYDEEVPDFIYQLPHLEELVISNPFPFYPLDFQFEKSASKSTLEVLNLSKLSSLESFNLHIGEYTHLKKLSLSLLMPKGKLDGLLKLKKLEYLYIKIDEKLAEDSKFYKVHKIADYSLHKYRSNEPITENQLQETIAEYDAYVQENEH